MDAPINNFIYSLNSFESQYLVPFFNNEIVIMCMIIFFALLALLIAPQHSQEKNELFSVPTYRLLWILMIILLTLYKPVIGLLSAISYLIFVKPQESESFQSGGGPRCIRNTTSQTLSDIQFHATLN
jgi:hypothetical protein